MKFAGTNCARRSASAWVVLVLSAALLVAAPGAQAQAPAKKAPGKSAGKAGTEQKYKAIFEPVNYPADVEFTDVHFASADAGWAVGLARSSAGEGGFILRTNDGGQNWTVQLGDPQSDTSGFLNLFFQDATHGWVGQWGGKLLRTRDGESWEEMGKFSQTHPYVFVSETTGYTIHTERILRTLDGGRSWKDHFRCAAKIEVEGLTREENCQLEAMHFPTPQVGYAVSRELANGSSAIVKTEDGGANWKVFSFLPGASGKEGSILFLDENNGFVRTKSGGKLFRTTDGGQTWTGVVATLPGGAPAVKFADSEVGWICLGNEAYSTLTYTTDGGKRWTSRQIRFPTGVNAFSLPRRDRGYVVGSHGMVYRYRIVPVEYAVKGMIDAPMMPVSKAEPSGKTGGPGAKREDEKQAEEPAPAGETKPGAGKAPTGRGGEVKPAAGEPAGAGGKKGAPGKTGAGENTVPLRSHADAQKILQGLVDGWQEKEVNVSLLGGQNYMVNDCLGVHPSVGEFTLKVASPNFRIEGSGIVLTFRIAHVSLNALKVRVRPNPTNVSNPCTFGGAIEMGGAASDLTYEMRFDPLLDVQQCKLGSVGQVRQTWRIGGLNLKPLQNDLDRAAKNMIEDALTNSSNFNALDRAVAGINGAAGVACHK